MKIQINKIYKSNGKTKMMPNYLIPISLYKYNYGEHLYELWDIQNGKMMIYSINAFLRYYEELNDET